MNYVIVDLEATCWEGRESNKNETIEIGAVLVNDKKQIISDFEQFVRPLMNPILSDFCKQLTSITQEQVDKAPYFYEAIDNFKNWINSHDEQFLLCSWGYYDKLQFEQDCKLHGLETDWLANHINLKHQYAQILNLRRAIGMKNTLLNEKMILSGTHHRGIDDARNITKIFLKYFDKWKK
jgi:inhibitor of KinA sporulation pathway (predicted exonuclease)